jgi:hypothetical protein
MRGVSFDTILRGCDAARVVRTLQKLSRCGVCEFSLTGGLAIELQLLGCGEVPRTRSLNDVDLAVASLQAIPERVADEFLVRHFHPKAPEGKMLIQLVDPSTALRVDVFCAYGKTLERSVRMRCGDDSICIVALGDLAAREASLLMDLESGQEVAAKHAQDFERIAEVVDLRRAELAWRDHRKQNDPVTFAEARERAAQLIESRGEMLVVPDYSHDADAICPKCEETGRFRLAPAKAILKVLGYC